MNTPKVLGCVSSIAGLPVIVLWFYLLYQILMRVEATTAMWTAYWVYLPLVLVASIFHSLSEALAKEDSWW